MESQKSYPLSSTVVELYVLRLRHPALIRDVNSLLSGRKSRFIFATHFRSLSSRTPFIPFIMFTPDRRNLPSTLSIANANKASKASTSIRTAATLKTNQIGLRVWSKFVQRCLPIYPCRSHCIKGIGYYQGCNLIEIL